MCGAAKQPARGVEKNIKYLIKHHDLKLVIIDVDCLYYKNSINGFAMYDVAKFIAPFKYHARWKELELKDFYTVPKIESDPLKGYIPQAKIRKYTLKEGYMANTDAAPQAVAKSVVKNMKNIAKLCEENNVELLLVCLPTPHSWNNAKSNGIQNLANELGVPFVDLNLSSADYNLDYSTSFRDNGNHLNVYGATYTTNFLVNYISSHYNLPDHRNEAKYKNWNELVPIYEKHIEMLIEEENK